MAGNLRIEGIELVPTATAPFIVGRRGLWLRESDGLVLLRQENGSDVDLSDTTTLQGIPIDVPSANETVPVYRAFGDGSPIIEWQPPLLADRDAEFVPGLGTRSIRIGQASGVGLQGENLAISASRGGASDGFTPGGTGGDLVAEGARGGDGTAMQSAGNGGSGRFYGGGAGQANGGPGGDAGPAYLDAGMPTALGVRAPVLVGTDPTRTSSVELCHATGPVNVANDLNVAGELLVGGIAPVLSGISPVAGDTLAHNGTAWVQGPRLAVQSPSFSSSMTFDPALGMVAAVTMTANLDGWAIMDGTHPGQRFVIRLRQDATGGRTILSTPSNFRPSYIQSAIYNELGFGDILQSLDNTANSYSLIDMIWDGTVWDGIIR